MLVPVLFALILTVSAGNKSISALSEWAGWSQTRLITGSSCERASSTGLTILCVCVCVRVWSVSSSFFRSRTDQGEASQAHPYMSWIVGVGVGFISPTRPS